MFSTDLGHQDSHHTAAKNKQIDNKITFQNCFLCGRNVWKNVLKSKKEYLKGINDSMTFTALIF